MLNIRPEAAAAAKWWADCLRSPRVWDNGDNSFHSFVAATMVNESQTAYPPVVIEAFEAALAESIERDLRGKPWHPENPDRGMYLRTIGCDYGPGTPIVEVCDRFGISGLLHLPCKTWTRISPGSVVAFHSYGVWNDKTVYPPTDSN